MDTVRPLKNTEVRYTEISGSAPARDAENVTPSDVTVYEPYIRALRVGVGGGGDLTVESARGTIVYFGNVQDGEVIPLWCARVLASGTTVSNIVAFYG